MESTDSFSVMAAQYRRKVNS